MQINLSNIFFLLILELIANSFVPPDSHSP